MGLIVLIWALAGVSLDTTSPMTTLGVPYRLDRPDVIPIGLIIAALYGVFRYYYYAMMLGLSPYRIRRDILDELWSKEDKKPGIAHTYWGPVEFTSSHSYSDRSKVDPLAQRIEISFPKFARARVLASVEGEESFAPPDGDEYISYHVNVNIPVRCRVAALFQDIDYALPVWFPMLSIAVYTLTLVI
ncbi:hypothetical protein ACFL3H_00300 [Gemmatimonadota bacterium]